MEGYVDDGEGGVVGYGGEARHSSHRFNGSLSIRTNSAMR